MPTKLIQTQGQGSSNPQLQDCPPDYHFELSEDELLGAIRNPQTLAQSLTAGGVPGLDHIKSIVVSYPDHETQVRSPTIDCCRPCLSGSVCCMVWPA